MNFNTDKTAGYNIKILIGNIDMKISLNRNINQSEFSHKKSTETRSLATPEITSMKCSEKLIKDVETMLPAGNQKVLAEQHNDEHYLFHLDCGSGLISHHFW